MSALLLPPVDLQARLDSVVLQRRYVRGLPDWEQQESVGLSRRGFLAAASAALAGLSEGAFAAPKSFSPPSLADAGLGQTLDPELPPKKTFSAPRRGEIPADFWERPRELWVKLHKSSEQQRVVYWADGQLQAEGYWALCALLRDRHLNVMTAIDPVLLDVLRGVYGYYQAWEYNKPLVATSAYRSEKTNQMLRARGEKAALNSMHLYGKACDLFIEGIAPINIAALGQHLQQGGVGYYPARGFTHLDTGRLKTWRG